VIHNDTNPENWVIVGALSPSSSGNVIGIAYEFWFDFLLTPRHVRELNEDSTPVRARIRSVVNLRRFGGFLLDLQKISCATLPWMLRERPDCAQASSTSLFQLSRCGKVLDKLLPNAFTSSFSMNRVH
jgi:hypothetical protein